MFKTETHLHVAEISPCSKFKAPEMVKMYHDKGYKTIVISDHFEKRYFESLGDISWDDKITIFLSGYYKAKEAAKEYGINVILSAEFTILSNDIHNHYLAYGITREFLNKYPEIYNLSIDKFYEIAKANNIMVVQAHPYRDEYCFPTIEYVDGIEVYNSNPRHNDYNDKAKALAAENGLYTTAGSDAHRLEDIGNSGILTENEIKTIDEFVEVIKSGKFEIIAE